MTAETIVLPLHRRVWAATVGDLVDLALAQPHQAMLSTGSVAIMAQFAAHSGIVAPLVGYCIALGVEWAYLRGLASASKAPTRWAAVLNWSAFAVVVLWGVLWVATVYEALPERPTGAAAFWLAVAHVVPIAWLSLCSAMCHQAAATLGARQADERRRRDEERRRRDEERAAKFAEEQDRLTLWAEAQRVKAELKATYAGAPMRGASNAGNARQERTDAAPQVCPNCGAELDRPRYLAARRWGRCVNCKGES